MKVYDITKKEDIPKNFKYYRNTFTIGDIYITNILLCRHMYIVDDNAWPNVDNCCYVNWYEDSSHNWTHNKIWVKKSNYKMYSNHLGQILAYATSRIGSLYLNGKTFQRGAPTDCVKLDTK
jgi:hypothetical protein